VLLGIDHLVIAVRSVEAAADVLERELGLAVTGGGRHEAMGTHNRLAFLGNTYVELIGVFDAGLVRSSPSFAVGGAALAHLEERGEGLATYALATDDVMRDAARLRAAGSPIGDPVAGDRVRPDGEVVRWVCAFPKLGPERPPFLIEHEAAGAEWGEEARATRAAFRHPGGGRVRLTALELPVADVLGVAREYRSVLGIAFDEGGRVAIGAQSVVLRAGAGASVVELAGDHGATPLDVERFGVRWRRVPASA
jgi:catechol 2,3-dioxygenase-like lactoylglutathione lyase family enzyme